MVGVVRHLLLSMVVLGTVAAWCLATPAPAVPATPIAPPVHAGPFSASRPWPSHAASAALELDCISARDGVTALVGGGVTEDADSHNALFLSRDGGRQWQAVGPALNGARTVAVAVGSGEQGWLWALTQEPEARSLTLLASGDHGRTWAVQALPQHCGPIHAARILPGPGPEAVLLLDNGDERELRTADAGLSWVVGAARPSAIQGQKRLTTADAWAWRLVDNRIERRNPVGGVWEATLGQPTSGYGLQPGLNVVVALAKGALPWG